ncbi:MAG: hypothetical protein JO112_15960 [Planctomycetes bacterium]|nr:hypothetical protein [Planctomycetota bacterium]
MMAMTAEQYDEFASFWGSEAKKYVLVSVEPTSTGLRHCCIFDRRYRAAVLIEDSELALEVMQHMVDAGVEIVSQLPED